MAFAINIVTVGQNFLHRTSVFSCQTSLPCTYPSGAATVEPFGAVGLHEFHLAPDIMIQKQDFSLCQFTLILILGPCHAHVQVATGKSFST
jgi:hypothetical protein